ncbi:hypothetical protein TRAPUB_5029, partial [Trametes pubescens]
MAIELDSLVQNEQQRIESNTEAQDISEWDDLPDLESVSSSSEDEWEMAGVLGDVRNE